MTLSASELTAAIHHENGAPEVTASWAAKHLADVRIIDVREPHELSGPLGKVDQAKNVPLLELLGDTQLDASTPLVLLCRSGRRSALAARELAGRGFEAIASIEGGMMAWNVEVNGLHDIHSDERVANTSNLNDAITHTNGIPEVSADWVRANLGRFTFIDVREPHELASSGSIPQAENHPMQAFMAEAGAIDREAPMVFMCASGGRSGRVTQALVGAGFKHVASMEGGMYGWGMRGLPHAG